MGNFFLEDDDIVPIWMIQIKKNECKNGLVQSLLKYFKDFIKFIVESITKSLTFFERELPLEEVVLVLRVDVLIGK